MEAIIIEKNIPIPAMKNNRGNANPFPFDRMNDGDSFLIPCSDTRERERARSRMGGRAFFMLKLRNLKLVSRTVPEGVRFWVVAKR